MLAQSSLITSLLGVAVLQHITYALLASRPLPAGIDDDQAQQRRQIGKTLRTSSFELLVLLFITWSLAAVVPGGALGTGASAVLILSFIAGRFLAWHGQALGARRTVGYLLSLLPAVVFAGAVLLGISPPKQEPVDIYTAEQAVAPALPDAALVGEVPPAHPYAELPSPPAVTVRPDEPTPILADAEALARYCHHAPQACDAGTERQRLEALLANMVNVVRTGPDHFASPQYRDIEAMAERRNPVALYQLGMLFNEAQFDRKYPPLKQASAAGYGPASYMLGRLEAAPGRIHYYHLALKQDYKTPELLVGLLEELAYRGTPDDCEEVRRRLAPLPAGDPIAMALGSNDSVRGCRPLSNAAALPTAAGPG